MKTIIKSPDVVLRKIDDEHLLVPVTNIIDNSYILRLNKVGAYIWTIIDNPKNIDEIRRLLKQKYGASCEIDKDLEIFLQKLKKLELITIADFEEQEGN